MNQDQIRQARDLAAAKTLERIRRKAAALSHTRHGKVLLVVAENLFEPWLDATQAGLACGIRDKSLSSELKDFIGETLRDYIEVAKIEVGDRMVRNTHVPVGEIGLAVGYGSHSGFLRAYARLLEERPSDVRGEENPPEIDLATWRRVWRRKLDPLEAREVHRKFLRLYPELEPTSQGDAGDATVEVPMIADGRRYERFKAEEFWREISDRPPQEQRQLVRRCRFESPVLFDVLRERSRVEGRRDPDRGVEVARLALESLEGCKQALGEEIHDKRTLGWAELGNAHRLAYDFPASDSAFVTSEEHWRVPRPKKDPLVLAEFSSFKGSLRMCQRNTPDAIDLAYRARDLFRREGDARGETRALTLLGSIHFYAGQVEAALLAHQEAGALLRHHGDPLLSFMVHDNLAILQVEVGRYDRASAKIEKCRRLSKQLDNPLPGYLKTQWLEAIICQRTGDPLTADRVFSAARIGFAHVGDPSSYGLISLDMAIFFAEQERWADALDLALATVPILKSFRLYPETLAAISLLTRALRREEVSAALLLQVRQALLRDPLIELRSIERTRGSSSPPD